MTSDGARGIRRAMRLNNAASAYGRSVDAIRPATGQQVERAGAVQCGGGWGEERQRGFMRERGDAEQATAVSAVALAVRVGRFLRRAAVVMRMRHAIGVNMGFRDCLIVMHMRRAVRLRQTMRRTFREREGGMRNENAKSVDRGVRKRRFESKFLVQTRQHRAFKIESCGDPNHGKTVARIKYAHIIATFLWRGCAPRRYRSRASKNQVFAWLSAAFSVPTEATAGR